MSAELVLLMLIGVLAGAGAAVFLLAPLRDLRPLHAATIATALLVVAGGLYLVVGRPDALRPAVAVDDPAEAFARSITERLVATPDDAAGWRMLGGVRTMQGRYAEATTAFARARGLSGDADVGALVGYAEAQALEDPSRLAALAPLFERALTLDPDNDKALWYGGHAAQASGDIARATALWKRLLQQELPDPLRVAVRARLEELAPSGPPLLEVEVSLDPAFAARVDPKATLFVFVRAPGSAAPVLVKRVAAPRFPLKVAFTAADRLGPEVALGTGATVGARLSLSGIATRGAGDIEGSSALAKGGITPVTLDQVVP